MFQELKCDEPVILFYRLLWYDKIQGKKRGV